MSRARACLPFAFLILVALLTAGCGSSRNSGRPDIDAIPEIEHRGGATKSAIYEFRAKVRKRGVAAAKQELPDLLENIEAHQKLKLGEHNATYKELADKLKALQGELGGSPSKDAVLKSIDDICTTAEKLPGQANKEPTVE
jgi:hypothetical protein